MVQDAVGLPRFDLLNMYPKQGNNSDAAAFRADTPSSTTDSLPVFWESLSKRPMFLGNCNSFERLVVDRHTEPRTIKGRRISASAKGDIF